MFFFLYSSYSFTCVCVFFLFLVEHNRMVGLEQWPYHENSIQRRRIVTVTEKQNCLVSMITVCVCVTVTSSESFVISIEHNDNGRDVISLHTMYVICYCPHLFCYKFSTFVWGKITAKCERKYCLLLAEWYRLMMGMGFLGLRIGMNAFEQRHKIKKSKSKQKQ